MSLRTRLVLVFLLLAVVPLGALVLYSYSSSLAAVRQAVETEAGTLTEGMETRMERIAARLDQRVHSLSEISPELLMRPGPMPDETQLAALNRRIAASLGDQASMLDALEFVPSEGSAPEAPRRTFVVKMAWEKNRRVMRWLHEVRSGQGPVTTQTLAEFPLAEVVGSLQGSLQGLAGSFDPEKAEELAHLAERLELPDFQVQVTVPGSAEPEKPEPGKAPSREAPALDAPSERGPSHPTPSEIPAPALAPPPPVVVVSGAPGRRPSPPTAPPPVPPEAPAEAVAAVREGEMGCPLTQDGRLVGHLKARLRPGELLSRVLAETDRARGELPFALDADGRLLVAKEEDRPQLEALMRPSPPDPDAMSERDGWLLVTREDPDSGYRFGLAHPLAASLQELRITAARNLGWGVLLIGLCFGGILPLSGRLTRNLQHLTDGTERLARGDLGVRVPVRSKDEVGRLAANFNRMAEELESHQRRLLEQERLRKEEEVERRLLEAENRRKSQELDEAREFQLSLLPSALPEIAGLDLAVSMTTATEVGGDYYDVRTSERGPLILAVGDATGHGTAAGTMVTVVKSLFIARAGETGPAGFLTEAGRLIRCMELGRRAMALTVLALDGRRLTLSSAGMPPVLRFRADGEVEEIALEGLPLGSTARIEGSYDQRTLDLEAGDTLLVATDGFAELLDRDGEPLGYDRARLLFAEAVRTCGRKPPRSQEVLDRLTAACRSWRGDRPLTDDVTFLVVRVA